MIEKEIQKVKLLEDVRKLIDTHKTDSTQGKSMHNSVVLNLVSQWIKYFDRAESVDKNTGFNDFYCMGSMLCILIYNIFGEVFANYDIHNAFQDNSELVIFPEHSFDDFTLAELISVQEQIRICLMSFISVNDDKEAQTVFKFHVDLNHLCLAMMYRMGQFMTCEWQEETTISNGQALRTDDGYCQLNVSTMHEFLITMHVWMSLSQMLLKCQQCVSSEELINFENHHREASLDKFYQISMTCDCFPSSILLYKNRFTELFHSINQVVYYNFPGYKRKRQISLDSLRGGDISHVHTLPLVCQFNPSIPVLFEHTGAGCHDVHVNYEWSWVVISNVVLLVDKNMNVYYNDDIRHMYALTVN